MPRATRVFRLLMENAADAARIDATFPLRHIAGIFGRSWRARLPRVGKITLRAGSSDAATIRQVFRDGDYDLRHLPQWPGIEARYRQLLDEGQVPLIIDAGANIGAASLWFATHYPGAQVIAVEPDAGNASAARNNLACLANARLIEAAIGATPGNVTLTSNSEAWAVQTSRVSTRGVPVCTVQELVQSVPRAGLFLVKIDIEGFEADLFSASTDWVAQAKVIIVEPHDWMASARGSSRGFQRVMGAVGFELLISGENLVYVAP